MLRHDSVELHPLQGAALSFFNSSMLTLHVILDKLVFHRVNCHSEQVYGDASHCVEYMLKYKMPNASTTNCYFRCYPSVAGLRNRSLDEIKKEKIEKSQPYLGLNYAVPKGLNENGFTTLPHSHAMVDYRDG